MLLHQLGWRDEEDVGAPPALAVLTGAWLFAAGLCTSDQLMRWRNPTKLQGCPQWVPKDWDFTQRWAYWAPPGVLERGRRESCEIEMEGCVCWQRAEEG